MFFSTGDEQGMQKLPRMSNEVRNAGGAGDAFLAGLAYAWLDDQELGDSIGFALTAADITLSHSATNSPALTLDAVNLAMETQRAG